MRLYIWISVIFNQIYTFIYPLFCFLIVNYTVVMLLFSVASTMLILVKTYTKMVCQINLDLSMYYIVMSKCNSKYCSILTI